MASVEKHEVKIIDKLGQNQRYRYLVECVCGWQGRCGLKTEAEQLAHGHYSNQTSLAASGGIRSGGL